MQHRLQLRCRYPAGRGAFGATTLEVLGIGVQLAVLALTAYMAWATNATLSRTPPSESTTPVLAWRLYDADVPQATGYPVLKSVLSFTISNNGEPVSEASWAFPGALPAVAQIEPGRSHDTVRYAVPRGCRVDTSANMAVATRRQPVWLDPGRDEIVLGCKNLQKGTYITGKLWYPRLLREVSMRKPRTRSATVSEWVLQYNHPNPHPLRAFVAVAVDRVLWAALVSLLCLFTGGAAVFIAGRP